MAWLNRRKHPRNEMQLPIAYRRLAGGLCWTRSYDVSAGGIRMRSLEEIPAGTALEISVVVPAARRERVLSSRGVVVWCRRDEGPDAVLSCGVMFHNMLPELMKLR